MASTRRAARTGGVSLYRQIFLALRDEILSGARPAGSVMPTEYELAAQFSVSRITARRALDDLAAAGLVERKRRVGTRVTYRNQVMPIDADVDHAVESLIAFGRRTQVRLVSFECLPADASTAELLEIDEDTPVVRALRVRLLEGSPLGAIESVIPQAVAGGLTAHDLTATPLLELIRASGHAIGAASQTISAVAADLKLAETLQIEPRAPLIRIDRQVRDPRGQPLLATTARYRGDRYRLTIDSNSPRQPEY